MLLMIVLPIAPLSARFAGACREAARQSQAEPIRHRQQAELRAAARPSVPTMELPSGAGKRQATRCPAAGFNHHKELFSETASQTLP
jgi:hypothetical protein